MQTSWQHPIGSQYSADLLVPRSLICLRFVKPGRLGTEDWFCTMDVARRLNLKPET